MDEGQELTDQEASDAAAERASAERRRALRVLVNIEVDYASEDTYLLANITDISATGIFVRTTTPAAIGTRLNVRFTPPDASVPLVLEGEVMWVNPHRPAAPNHIHPGMGIRFVALSAAEQQDLEFFVRRIAYLG